MPGMHRDARPAGAMCLTVCVPPCACVCAVWPQGCVPLEAAHHLYDLVVPYQNAALEAAKRAFQVGFSALSLPWGCLLGLPLLCVLVSPRSESREGGAGWRMGEEAAAVSLGSQLFASSPSPRTPLHTPTRSTRLSAAHSS